jgi:hypothetical protein
MGVLTGAEFVHIPMEALKKATMEEMEAYLVYMAEYAKDNEDDWNHWLNIFFHEVISSDFSDAHARFYDWVWNIEAGVRPQSSWVSIWPRGYAKSSSLEMAVAALAAMQKRKYCLFVSGTLDQAEDHVAAIAALLSNPMIARAYPQLGTPKVSKEGNTAGWRRDRLVTSTGFVIDALGMDSSARGAKFEDQRPDLIAIDDIDSESDSELVTEKKVKIITQKLIPAGAPDVAFIFVQNMVHKRSVFARLASHNEEGEPPRADWLKKRIVDGPIPAVRDMEIRFEDGHYKIVDGKPSWPARFDIPKCQELMDDMGYTAFLAECQHETTAADGDIFSHLVFKRIDESMLPKIKRTVVWIDPAVTSTDVSDSMGIQIDSLGVDKKIYRRYSWESRGTPYATVKKAVLAAIEYKADVVGIETNQGGIIWREVYDQVIEEIRKETAENGGDFFRKMPRYKEIKATSSTGSKVERAERMLADYERDTFRHVEGTAEVLEASLRRFPKVKPFDLVDAAVWSWAELAGPLNKRKVKMTSTAKRQLNPQNWSGA